MVACQLKPLVRSDYDFLLLPLTDAQWATLKTVFPGGVCANGKRGRGQGPSQTWLTYADRDGDVVYGGRNLPQITPHQAVGWSSPTFAEALTK